MPIPFLSSIGLNKNEVQDFKVFNLASDPTLTSGGDFGYFWLNTSGTKTLKFWDGANIRSLIDSTTISSSTAGTANDLSGGVAGSLPYQQGVGDTTFLGIGSSGYILTSTGSAPQWSASIPSSSVSGLAASATTDTTNASNISSGTLGLARLSLASGQFYVGDGSNNPAATAKSSIPLSGFGNAAADINIGGFKITNSGTIGSGDADSTVATKGYVDSVAQGLDVKASCLVATTTDITLASPGAVTIDGIYSATDFTAGTTRILVKDQSAPAENGIYIWQGPAAAMTRSSDANTWDELVGAFTFIERGTANADSGWVCTVNAGGTLGTTAVTFVKFSQAGSYTAGNGIVQSGTSFNFAQSSAYTAGQIPFASSTTAMGFNANLHWDNSNNRLGIGTATPGGKLEITSNTNGQNRLFLNNPSTGSGAYVSLDFTAGTSNNQILSMGSGYSGSFPYSTGALVIRSNNVNGIVINTSGSSAPITFGINDSTAMTLNGTGLGVGVVPNAQAKLDVAGNVWLSPTAAYSTAPSAYLGVNVYTNTGVQTWAGRIVAGKANATAGDVNGYLAFQTNSSTDGIAERLRIDSSGNVGIGTATPGALVEISRNTVGEALRLTRSSDLLRSLRFVSSDNVGSGAKWSQHIDSAYGAFGWTSNSVERMLLDASGNLGLGVTPSAWQANWKVLQFANGSSIGNPFNGEGTFVGSNAYRNSSGDYIRLDAGFAALYLQLSGSHRWHVAGSSTAGSTIPSLSTGSHAMILDSSGNLGLGVTPSAWGAGLKALQVGAVSYGSLFDFGNGVTSLSSNLFFSGSSYGRMSTSSRWSMAYWQDITNGAHSWVTSTAAGTNASTPTMSTLMLLDSSGRLIRGDTTADSIATDAATMVNIGNFAVQYTKNTGNFLVIKPGAPLGTVDLSADARTGAYPDMRFLTGGASRLSIKSTGQINFVGLASDPAGAAGDVVYNSTSNRLKYHNGTAWVDSGTRKVSVVGGAGTGTYIDATHNFNTKTVSVTVLRTTDNVVVYTDVAMTNDNTVRVTFASSVTLADYTVTVIG